jgi:Ferritin-like
MKRHRLVWSSPEPEQDRKMMLHPAVAAIRSPVLEGAPTYSSPLNYHDEAIFLLHTAAEIEHSLMVQYLYAGYSLDPNLANGEDKEKVQRWQREILHIAREEMGHLVTVQNVLRLIGGPLKFGREEYPFSSEFYPFPFELRPLSAVSLAKYIVAEMPEKPADDDIDEIKRLAQEGNAGNMVNSVGKLYEAITALLKRLDDADFQSRTVNYQADFDTWGRDYARGPRGGLPADRKTPELIIRAVRSRTTALEALAAVAEQGEGIGTNEADEFSHYQRFLAIYREFKNGGKAFVRPIAINPSTMAVSGEKVGGGVVRITHPVSLLWAQLFNKRYRLLLGYLIHAFYTEGALVATGSPSPHGRLVAATFSEMYNLRSLAGILMSQPVAESNSDVLCGPPFELPYTLALADSASDRWRVHRDVIEASEMLINGLQSQDLTDTETKYLEALASYDRTFLFQIEQILRIV